MPQDEVELIDECLSEIMSGKTTPEACAARYPQYPRLAAQLRIALALRTAPVPRLSPTDRSDLRERILARAAQLPQPQPQPPARRPVFMPRRWLPAVVSALVAFVLIFGALPALAQPALPGDVLYPVKRAVEQVRLTLASVAERPDIYLDLARTRLNEYEALSMRGTPSAELLDEATREIGLALSDMAASPAAQTQPALSAALQLIDRTDALTVQLGGSDKLAGTLGAYRQQASALMATPLTPTATATSTATATATVAPTDTPGAGALPPVEDPSSNDKTPPGQVRTPQPPNTPPGQVRTPKPPNTPPGQVRTPKPPNTPPGQVNTPRPTPEPPTPKPTKELKPTKEPKE